MLQVYHCNTKIERCVQMCSEAPVDAYMAYVRRFRSIRLNVFICCIHMVEFMDDEGKRMGLRQPRKAAKTQTK